MATQCNFTLDAATFMMLSRLGNRWSLRALLAVVDGPIRFNQLRRELAGISQKMLSHTLKTLERDGLVTRTAIATVPVTVEYSITPLGRTLVDTVDGVREWSDRNMEIVIEAQTRFDKAKESEFPYL